MNESIKNPLNKRLLVIRAIICVFVIFIGFVGMKSLGNMKKPPLETEVMEKSIRVETMVASPKDYPVFITGYGELMVQNALIVSPEVSGLVVAVHSNLDPGGIVEIGSLLFQIDDRNYVAQVLDLEASRLKWDSTVLRMKKQERLDRARLGLTKRRLKIAENDYKRIQILFKDSGVGTYSGVEKAEQLLINARDRLALMEDGLKLLPLKIKEAAGSRDSILAKLDLARINVKRCLITAPFSGRIRKVSLELGQYVSPGQQILTLADDSVLEVHVSLDSVDVRKWLKFGDTDATDMWFPSLEKNRCFIRWTEDEATFEWKGELTRVTSFSPKTRTVTVAVKVTRGMNPMKKNPLVEGMYCLVRIPGRSMENVTKIPRWAVSYKGDLYLSQDGRLMTKRVDVVRLADESAFVKGLSPGDRVITTRLVDPLENVLLELTEK